MTAATPTMIPCPVCKGPMVLRPTKGKTGIPGLMWMCPKNGRHFRGFITDPGYVDSVLALSGEQETGSGSEGGE